MGLTLFNSSVYFVGTYDGRVALFQGLPYAVLGNDLYHVVEVAPTDYSPLAPYLKGRVDAHDLTTKEAGQRFIRGLPRRTTPVPSSTRPPCRGRTPAGSTPTTVPRPAVPLSRRNRELLFLFPALLVTTVGFASVYIRRSDSLDWYSLGYGAIFLGLFGLVHLVRRVLAPQADPYLLPITALLSSLGILLIYRIDEKLALQQAEWLLVGLVVFVAVLVLFRHYEVLADYRYLVGFAGIGLLLFTILAAHEVNGARLWVRLGPIGFQPGEFAKLLLVVFFAAYLADVRELLAVSTRRVVGIAMPPFRYLAPLLAVWLLSLALMVFVKDLGTSLLFFCALLALLYVATGRPLYVVTGLLLFAGGAFVLYNLFGHVQTRVDMWLDPWRDVAGRGYQIVQSLFALASGGLFGKGLGQGYLTAAERPHHHPGARDRLHLLRHRRGVGVGRSGGHRPSLLHFRLPGSARGPRRAGRLLPIAGHGPHGDVRSAGLHHHRGCDQAHPSDRHHPALRELWRELDRRELRPGGLVAPGKRPGHGGGGAVRSGSGGSAGRECSRAAVVRAVTDGSG